MPRLIENFDSPMPAISINAYGVILNTACITLLSSPEFVAIGVDQKEKKLAIKPLKRDRKAFRCYPYVLDEKNFLIVRSSKLIRVIERLGVKINDDKMFMATFNPVTGILVVELEQEYHG